MLPRPTVYLIETLYGGSAKHHRYLFSDPQRGLDRLQRERRHTNRRETARGRRRSTIARRRASAGPAAPLRGRAIDQEIV